MGGDGMAVLLGAPRPAVAARGDLRVPEDMLQPFVRETNRSPLEVPQDSHGLWQTLEGRVVKGSRKAATGTGNWHQVPRLV